MEADEVETLQEKYIWYNNLDRHLGNHEELSIMILKSHRMNDELWW